MSTKNILSIQDIYDLAKRGAMEIAYKLGVHIKTVDRWNKFGIPDSYFEFLNKEYGVTYYEFCKLNAKIRGYGWR